MSDEKLSHSLFFQWSRRDESQRTQAGAELCSDFKESVHTNKKKKKKKKKSDR